MRTLPAAARNLFGLLMIGAVLLAPGLAAAQSDSGGGADHPGFVDISANSGLNHIQRQRHGLWDNFAQGATGGAAVGDFDGDGYTDIFFTRNDDTDLLYRNNGDGTFTDITESVFGDQMVNAPTNGALFFDANNNGHLDLYVTATAHDRYYFYENDGNGKLVERAVEWGIDHQMPSNGGLREGMSATAGDYDNNGYLDLYVAGYVSPGPSPKPENMPNRLFRNTGEGFMVDVTEEAGIANGRNRLGFSGRFADMNRDGRLDLLQVNDYTFSNFSEQTPEGNFELKNTLYGTGLNHPDDMGTSVADFNNSGYLDWFITAISDRTGNRLYENQLHRGIPGVYYTEVAEDLGVNKGGYWGWGTSFIDFDNNGLRDIVMVNGFSVDERTPMRFWRNGGPDEGFKFTEISEEIGLTDRGEGRGLVVADFLNNGFLDILVVNHMGAPVLYQNLGNDNRWLRINTIGEESNRMGIGAWITVTPSVGEDFEYVHEINLGANFLSHNETTAHFGLGDYDGLLDVKIEWPSGTVQTFEGLGSNELYTIHEVHGIDGAIVMPEPATLLVLGVGSLVLLRRPSSRRRRRSAFVAA